MRPTKIGLRLAIGTIIGILGYYILRPIYWQVSTQLQERAQFGTITSSDVALSELVSGPDSEIQVIGPQGNSTYTSRRAARLAKKQAAREMAKLAAAKALSELRIEEMLENEGKFNPNEASSTSGNVSVKVETVEEKHEDVTVEDPKKDNVDSKKVKKLAKGVRPIVHEGRPLAKVLRHKIWEKPKKSNVPSKEEFALRQEMVQYRSQKNIIVVTFANFAFMDFVINWVRHLTDVGVYNILVGAMDEKILEGLYQEGIPVFDMESHMAVGDVGWGSPTFHAMGREKVTLINVFLDMGFEILMCDTDMVWTQNPLPYLDRWPNADIFTSSDNVVNTVNDDSLEKFEEAMASYNIGILHFRCTEPARAMAFQWAEWLANDTEAWDQSIFNDVMRQRPVGPLVPEGGGTFWAHTGKVQLAILPVSIFCSGHTYFVQRMYRKVGLQPYAVHTTFQYAGTEGKRHRLREAKLFYDPPPYYDPPGGILTFTQDIPEKLLSGGKHTVDTHFKLVNYQLLRLRNALAIASILDRTLVLPEFWCRFDRMWYPHGGILEGTDTPQPFLCPADHILEINNMLDSMDEATYGPMIPFREYSFLQNPRTTESFLESKVHVKVCPKNSTGCKEASQGTKAEGSAKPDIILPENATESEIVDALSPLVGVKVVEFSTMLGVFGGWDDKVRQGKFEARIKQYTGIWCCMNLQPGHIWYDFFTDQKPGWAPKPPTTPMDDHRPY